MGYEFRFTPMGQVMFASAMQWASQVSGGIWVSTHANGVVRVSHPPCDGTSRFVRTQARLHNGEEIDRE
jgi:hypothetical protein